ncbi:permease prefix domain 1-containing protein [Saccharopolyspora sp. K220]|uniref:permease prefix domain 1-containing protein n=1 Tax=Saccharopolyspora soli TaxID=2926618 RepID=UPI001F594B5E|nr:permease prefix domain 1-containing protein [Saccharopolyspora soli]MCI2418143.1 permease prefix domain 1-containing protein [Saccharopolyspora soli]
MTASSRQADPIENYAAALAAALHGPARAKARMVQEMRDGLADTVAAYTDEGMPYQRAVQQAVREFGTAEELVPSCQQELTVAQTRHTARALLITVPFLLACWSLIWTADHDRGLPPPAQLLAGVAVTAALLAALTLVATGVLARWLDMPHRLPFVVAWSGTTASVAMALATVTLAIASPLAANWFLIALAGALSVVSHGVVAASARACRECARLDS